MRPRFWCRDCDWDNYDDGPASMAVKPETCMECGSADVIDITGYQDPPKVWKAC